MVHQYLHKQNIVLIGFMGVGKTTVGYDLAKKLNYTPIDIDTEIEKKYQMPTTDIFNQFGETTFREEEKTLTLQWTNAERKVLSLGGGAFLQHDLKQACLDRAIVIYLDMSWVCWTQRLSQLIPTRPLLQGKSLEDIKALYEERMAYYESHHYKINVDGLTVDEVSERIVNTFKTSHMSI